MSGRTRLTALSVGFVGGLISGLLGIGGGVVMVPGLVLVLGIAQRRAHATSLTAIVPIGAIGAVLYAADGGTLSPAFAALLAAGAVVGAPLGVRVLSGMPEGVLRAMFILVVAAAGVRMLLS